MHNYAYCSDKYQYTMGKSFFDSGMKDQHAVFNLFYRKAPENNNWAVVSGVDEVLDMVANLGNMDPAFFEKFLLREVPSGRGVQGFPRLPVSDEVYRKHICDA